MRTNEVKRQLREGETTLGSWLTLPDVIAAHYMARAGFDWLTVDMEHSPTSLETATLMFQAIAQAGCVPLARVPWNTPENVKRVLDSGAFGVVFPMQNTRAEVEQAVGATLFPPQGFRSVGASLPTLAFDTDGGTYFQRANDEILVVIQIEHIQAVECAEDLLSVPGVDAVFIGPADLSASMGLQPGASAGDPRFQEAVEHVRATAARLGVAPGIHVFSVEDARARLAQGFRFVALGSEARFMTGAAQAALDQIR
ncbi:MAG TPA: 2-dehydro-3-deoxyglucarate aldolase [Armatimonadetes bacterium]|jgi:4-hydroxy-2-oxoheptanedioate aldolase|nr:2-dehydro-3-deoxyglucarate aldolase [Armatimonadota bacterium]